MVWCGVVRYGASDAWYAEMKNVGEAGTGTNNKLTLFDEEDELFGH